MGGGYHKFIFVDRLTLYTQAVFSGFKQTLAFDDAVHRYKRAFIETQMPLYKQLAEFKEKQRLEEEERNSALPTSMAEFDLIKSREHQIRVARFLEKNVPLPPFVKSTAEDVQSLRNAYNDNVRDSA
jgi:hypothetical protein